MIYDAIIIGAGPAGLCASVYLRRNEKSVLILEKEAPGGKMATTFEIENYPGTKKQNGFDLAFSFYNQALSFNPEFRFEEALSIVKDGKQNLFFVTTTKNKYQAKTVLIATGMKNRRLEVKGEDRFINRGISFCAICDGAFHKGKEVAVIGGGNSALEEALFLTSIASKVTIIQNLAKFTGDEKAIKQVLENKKISVLFSEEVTEFLGSDKLETIKLKSGKLINVSAAFLYIGFVPETKLYKNLGICDDRGFIIVDKNNETKIKGLFAAGDTVVKEVRQIVTATSDGAIAALNMIKDL